jgi:hypothetical protein
MSDDGNLERGGVGLKGQANEESTPQDEATSDSSAIEGAGLHAGMTVVAQEVGEVAGEVVAGIVGDIIGSILSD